MRGHSVNTSRMSSKTTESRLKQQYGWSIGMYLPLVPWVGNLMIKWRLSANAVSLLSFVAFGIGLVVYLQEFEGFVFRMAVVLLFAIGTLLDVVDGYVARVTATGGRGGAVLDAVLDVIRYNLFFGAVFILRDPNGVAAFAILLYAILVNISFARTVWRAFKGRPRQQLANGEAGRFLPKWYREFCLRHRLLYNPFNLEDQLNLGLFVIGVLFQIEIAVVACCLVARVCETILIAIASIRSFSELTSG